MTCCELMVVRPAADLPQTTTQDLFVVSGGAVVVTAVIGEVTAAIQEQTTNITLYAGSVGAVWWSSNISSQPAGKYLGWDEPGASMIADTVVRPILRYPLLLHDGVAIKLSSGASSTGQIKWTLLYRPIDPGAKVTAA